MDDHGTVMHVTNKEIDDTRKDCQRLADKAVGQYKKAKTESSRQNAVFIRTL